MSTILQRSKIELTNPSNGLVYEVKSFTDIKIKHSFDNKIANFSVSCEFFDDTDVKQFSVGTEVRIWTGKKDEELEQIFTGIVSEVPRSIDGIKRIYEFSGTDLGKTQNVLVNEVYLVGTYYHDIFTDLMTKYGAKVGYGIGNVVPTLYNVQDELKFKNKHLYTVLEEICDAIDYTFSMDIDKNISFYPSTSITSDIVLTNNMYTKGSSKFSLDMSRLVNYLVVRGGTGTSLDETIQFHGDGLNSLYPLLRKPRQSSTGGVNVTLNGVTQSVGIENIDKTGKDCLINFSNKTIQFFNKADMTKKILTATDLVGVTYEYEFPLETIMQDTESQLTYGYFEDTVTFNTILDMVALRDKAKLHLNKYSKPILTGEITTWLNHWNAGDLVQININTNNGTWVNDTLQVTEKNISIRPNFMEVGYSFEQKPNMTGLIKSIVERLRALETEENSTVEQFDIFTDSFAVNDTVKITTRTTRFAIGSSTIGSVI
jgi:hypothetical protein